MDILEGTPSSSEPEHCLFRLLEVELHWGPFTSTLLFWNFELEGLEAIALLRESVITDLLEGTS